ncbi:nucleoid-associated protein (plasmid) [Clostridium botulinum C/D str. BKT12695]|nr:nucleoid-associated protein [Clostridium botulinum C/D str. BKT12695]
MGNIFQNMNINRIILHEVFKRKEDKSIEEPLYNDNITELEDSGKFIFRERVIQAIGNDSHSVEMQIYKSNEGSTFELAKKIINCKDNDFIDYSKKIAYNLAVAQNTRRIPEGIIVIFDGTIGNNNNEFVGVMKAEMQKGFQLSKKIEGLSLEFIENLVLTPQQKFYKIGLFTRLCSNESEDIKDYICYVYDNNLGRGVTSEAAQYFYDGFLGCKFKENNKFLTKQFYTDTKEFINNSNITDKEKVELNYALYTYAKVDQNQFLSIKDFSEKYLNNGLKDDYTNYMEKNKFPATNIVKDLALLESSLKNRKIKFTDNISLVVPSDKFKDSIKIEKTDEGYTNIQIKGHIVSQQ